MCESIVVGTDGSATAKRAVAEAARLAKALGYTENSSKVDKAKFPTYMPGQGCDTCRFFQGKSGQAFGPCQIFMGKEVNINGWCASYAKKA